MVRFVPTTKESVAEANRIRGEGWTIAPVRRRPSKPEPKQPPADSATKPDPDGPDAAKTET